MVENAGRRCGGHWNFVSKSEPDGYTLLIGVTGSNGIAGALYPNLPYDTVKGFTPVTAVVSAPLLIVKNPKLPRRTCRNSSPRHVPGRHPSPTARPAMAPRCT